MAPTGPMVHANSRRPLAGNAAVRTDALGAASTSGHRAQAPPYRRPFSAVNSLKVPCVRPLFELATQLIKILYGLV